MAFGSKWSSMFATSGVVSTAKLAHDRASTPSRCPFVRKAKQNVTSNEAPIIILNDDHAHSRPNASANTSLTKTIERLNELQTRDEKRQCEEELNRVCAFYGMSKEEAQRVFSPSELKRLEYMSVLYASPIVTGRLSLPAKQIIRAFMIEGMSGLDVSELKYALLMKVGAAHECTLDD
jgi:hypothetical protein